MLGAEVGIPCCSDTFSLDKESTSGSAGEEISQILWVLGEEVSLREVILSNLTTLSPSVSLLVSPEVSALISRAYSC